MLENTKKTLEDNLEEFDNGFWLHRVPKYTKQMKDVKSYLSTSQTKLIESIIEDLEEEKKSFYVGAGACYKNEAKEAILNDIADNLKSLINPKEEIGCSNCGELLKESEIELGMCKDCRESEEFGQKFG
jgi:hypothetical protein